MSAFAALFTFGVTGATFARAAGGLSDDIYYSIHRTADGGYVCTGTTYSFGAGNRDMLFSRYDAGGNLLYSKALGNSLDEEAYSSIPTPDGGWVLCGYTNSSGAGSSDLLVVKVDSGGTPLWARTLGDGAPNGSYSLTTTSDDGFLLVGYTYNPDSFNYDALMAKFNQDGSPGWWRKLGNRSDEIAYGVVQSGNDFLLTGTSKPFASSVDLFSAKVDGSGNLLWDRGFTEAGDDVPYALALSPDNGYVITGYTTSYGPTDPQIPDVLVLKYNSGGSIEWGRGIGDYWPADEANDVILTADGGYAIAGWTRSHGAGGADAFIINFNSTGVYRWGTLFGEVNSDSWEAVVERASGGFASAGLTYSYGAGAFDAFLGSLESDGSSCAGTAFTPYVYDIQPTIEMPVGMSSDTVSFAVGTPVIVVTDFFPAETTICPTAVAEGKLPALPLLVRVWTVQGGLGIAVTREARLEVYDPAGRLVKSLTLKGKGRVELSTGVYFVRAVGGNRLKGVVR